MLRKFCHMAQSSVKLRDVFAMAIAWVLEIFFSSESFWAPILMVGRVLAHGPIFCKAPDVFGVAMVLH